MCGRLGSVGPVCWMVVGSGFAELGVWWCVEMELGMREGMQKVERAKKNIYSAWSGLEMGGR